MVSPCGGQNTTYLEFEALGQLDDPVQLWVQGDSELFRVLLLLVVCACQQRACCNLLCVWTQ